MVCWKLNRLEYLMSLCRGYEVSVTIRYDVERESYCIQAKREHLELKKYVEKSAVTGKLGERNITRLVKQMACDLDRMLARERFTGTPAWKMFYQERFDRRE